MIQQKYLLYWWITNWSLTSSLGDLYRWFLFHSYIPMREKLCQRNLFHRSEWQSDGRMQVRQGFHVYNCSWHLRGQSLYLCRSTRSDLPTGKYRNMFNRLKADLHSGVSSPMHWWIWVLKIRGMLRFTEMLRLGREGE